MDRLVTIVLMLALAGCATDAESRMTAEALMPLVREHAFSEKPKLNPSIQFKIKEYRVEGLHEALKIQLFLARYMSPDGQQFNERLLLYHDRKLIPFASTVGGFGLMSAVVSEDALYYTYSWGSGQHRSHIGYLSLNGDKIEILESGGYMSTDLFVRKVEDGILVEAGRFDGFNSWESAEEVGWVKRPVSSLAIVDAMGAEVLPSSP